MQSGGDPVDVLGYLTDADDLSLGNRRAGSEETRHLSRFTDRQTIRDKRRFSSVQQRGELRDSHVKHHQDQAKPLKGC